MINRPMQRPLSTTELEALLVKEPHNLEVRRVLVDNYFLQIINAETAQADVNYQAWVDHVFWLITHAPASEVAGGPSAMLRPYLVSDADYERGKKLWLAQTVHFHDNPAVLRNAGSYLRNEDSAVALPILESAYRLAPNDPELAGLLSDIYHKDFLARASQPNPDPKLIQQALTLGEIALNDTPRRRYYRLGKIAMMAWEAGAFLKAHQYAAELLEIAEHYRSDWNFGNAIHDGNILLGRLSLREGDIEEACRRLLEAGRTPGSPQLNSLGPDLTLAQELLGANRKEAVLQYLELCSHFWALGQQSLEQWRMTIIANQTPNFEQTI